MKLTVSTTAGTLPSFLAAGDVVIINNYIAKGLDTTISIKNFTSGATLYVETLDKVSTTANGYPLGYLDSMQVVLRDINSISLVASGSTDVRILLNALPLTI